MEHKKVGMTRDANGENPYFCLHCTDDCPACAVEKYKAQIRVTLNICLHNTQFGIIDPKDSENEWTITQMEGAEAAYKYLLKEI